MWSLLEAFSTADKNADTNRLNGANLWLPGQHHAYRCQQVWGRENPAAAKLFAIHAVLPVADINAQNAIMHDGKASEGDIQGHVDG